jgi:hypothetical protein
LISENANGTILFSIPVRHGNEEALRTLRVSLRPWRETFLAKSATFTQRAQRNNQARREAFSAIQVVNPTIWIPAFTGMT